MKKVTRTSSFNHRRTYSTLFTILIFSILLSGCGTFAEHVSMHDYLEHPENYTERNKPDELVYAGTKADLEILKMPFDMGWYLFAALEEGHFLFAVPFTLFSSVTTTAGLIDLPLSFVADTALLPYAVSKEQQMHDLAITDTSRKTRKTPYQQSIPELIKPEELINTTSFTQKSPKTRYFESDIKKICHSFRPGNGRKEETALEISAGYVSPRLCR